MCGSIWHWAGTPSFSFAYGCSLFDQYEFSFSTYRIVIAFQLPPLSLSLALLDHRSHLISALQSAWAKYDDYVRLFSTKITFSFYLYSAYDLADLHFQMTSPFDTTALLFPFSFTHFLWLIFSLACPHSSMLVIWLMLIEHESSAFLFLSIGLYDQQSKYSTLNSLPRH